MHLTVTLNDPGGLGLKCLTHLKSSKHADAHTRSKCTQMDSIPTGGNKETDHRCVSLSFPHTHNTHITQRSSMSRWHLTHRYLLPKLNQQMNSKHIWQHGTFLPLPPHFLSLSFKTESANYEPDKKHFLTKICLFHKNKSKTKKWNEEAKNITFYLVVLFFLLAF